MKIFFYCQHVLGVGHLFRSLEICRALAGHEVLFISGGPHIKAHIPKHVRVARLPELRMDPGFKGLYSSDPQLSVAQIKKERQKNLFALFESETPDVFLIEMYPFGRKAFRFELDALLAAIENRRLPACKVVCSVRDILVEKEHRQKHEKRVVKILNHFFDAVLVHSDPQLIKIEETFLLFDEIKIPVIYTGFVTRHAPASVRKTMRERLGLREQEILIVASAGGGSVGAFLLESVVNAFYRLQNGKSNFLRVYTGPYIAPDDFESLKNRSGPKVFIGKFSSDFLSYLAAADLSISMAGYNTSMNILAAGVPALVWPFPQNREQKMRADRLAGLGALKVLRDQELATERLAPIIEHILSRKPRGQFDVNLDGAARTARWLKRWTQGF